MSLLDPFRPQWKRSDPEVRKAAVETLTDDKALADVFESDPIEEIRRMAFDRLTDEAVLAKVAMGAGPLNMIAAVRLTQPRWLADVAKNAESPEVRAQVVSRIGDRALLHRISSSDTDLRVRLRAKSRGPGPDRMHEYLRNTLTKLQVAEARAGAVAGFCGSLDDICGELIGNDRYRITGVTNEPGFPRGNLASTNHEDAAALDPNCVEFLAVRTEDTQEPFIAGRQRVFFRVKVWRHGENDFTGAVEERRYELASNTVAWSESSKNHDGTTAPV